MRLLRAWLLCASVDFVFSSVLSVLYGRTAARVWQGVAATAFGPEMLDAGLRATLTGVAIHLCVAFAWSTVLLLLISWLPAVSRALASPYGVLKVAAIYGPAIWLFMSFVVIRTATGQPISITYRWWIQFFGHIPFVAVPIAWALKPGSLKR